MDRDAGARRRRGWRRSPRPKSERVGRNDIPEDMRGRAFGGLTSAIFLGQFLSPLISSPISARLGLRLTFRVGGIVLIGLSIVFLALSSRGRVGNQPTEGGEQDDEGIDSSVSKDVD